MGTKIIKIKSPENLSIAKSVAPENPPPLKTWLRWLNITHYSRRKTHERTGTNTDFAKIAGRS